MANNNLASIPEVWAREGLMVLTENAPAAAHVDRQFSDDLANFGDTVNAYRAAKRTIRRKTDDDQFVANDVSLTAVPVKLDQWFYDTILIKDGEMSKSIANLTQTHLVPVMQGIGRAVDRAILGRVHGFLQNGSPAKRAGKLGGMTKTNSPDYILEAQEVLELNNAPGGVYNAIVHPTTQTFLRGNSLFASAEQRGSAETLTTGRVGQVYNTNIIMSQNVNHVNAANADTQSATVNNSGGYAAGEAGALTVTDPGDNWVVGEFAVLTENGQPTWVATTASATSITLNEALKYAVTDSSAITHYKAVTNEATERAAGYAKEMVFTHTSGKQLQVGQLLAFGTGSARHTYTIIEVSATTATTSTVLLDRPLEATVAASASAFPGPGGAMNPVFHPQALALVSRPLAIPGNEFGVLSSVQSFNGIGLRVTMQYDSKEGGLRVNVDLLSGIKELNTDLMAVMLA